MLNNKTTMQPVGAHFKRIAEITLPLELIHEAQGWAQWDKAEADELGDARRAAHALEVSRACGRLLMLAVGGHNRRYDPGPDRALINAYLHPQPR